MWKKDSVNTVWIPFLYSENGFVGFTFKGFLVSIETRRKCRLERSLEDWNGKNCSPPRPFEPGRPEKEVSNADHQGFAWTERCLDRT